MASEVDIEDLLGAGCLASLARALEVFSCLWLGAATGSLAFVSATAGGESLAGGSPDLEKFATAAFALMAWGPFTILASMLIPLFFPLVLLVYFKFARGDGGTLRAWVIYAGITGALVLAGLLSAQRPGWSIAALGFFLWVGFAGSLGMLAVLFSTWQRRRLAEHLAVVAAQNDARRRELAGEVGSAVADLESAIGPEGDRRTERPGSRPDVPNPPRPQDES